MRQDLLERLLNDLRRVQPGSPPQHQLLIGQRGLGKTTLLRRLAFALEDDSALSVAWMPLVFPEEQYNVKNLGDFWLNCADALSDALDRTGNEQAAHEVDSKVALVPADSDRRSAAALSLLLDEAARLGRGLVLLVDNLDIVLDRLDHQEEWEFRRIISQEHRLYFVGASNRALEALYEHGRAFYDFFQVHDLKGFNDAEMFALLGQLAEQAGDHDVQRLIREKPGRIRALRILTGGNPRTLMLLYRILSQGPEGDVQRDLEQLLDLYTPLYKSRFEEMAPQSQQVVDAMAIHWDPVTAADLADKLAPLSINTVSAQLKRLEDYGVVEKAEWFGEKKAAFQIAERFFNIWYLMRSSRRVRRRLIWLVKFLESWLERDELSAQARTYLERDPKSMGPGRYAEMALAYSQTVDDRFLKRSLESAALRAALDESVRGQFDFSDLPPELQSRKERMERLSDLRARVLGMRLDGIDDKELWRVLGGCPGLTLVQVASLVGKLPSFKAAYLQHINMLLKDSEESYKYGIPQQSEDIARLYEALATGDMADVYDLEGAVSIARQEGRYWLPGVAIALWQDLTPEQNLDSQLSRIQDALLYLDSEPGCKAMALYVCGDFLHRRMERYDEAELAYRRALEVDPTIASSWNRLGLIHGRSGRFAEAEDAYRRAIQVYPLDSRSWEALGVLFDTHFGRDQEAEQALRRAIELDPRSSLAWGALAHLLEKHGNRKNEALDASIRAAELHPGAWKSNALQSVRSVTTGPLLATALKGVTRLHELSPEDTEIQFVQSGLLALSGEWEPARALLEKLAASELEKPDIWTFAAAVKAGHAEDLINLLEQTGANERWRPLYEALRAIRAGSAHYLRRVAPEIRSVAEPILAEIAPDLPKTAKKRVATSSK